MQWEHLLREQQPPLITNKRGNFIPEPRADGMDALCVQEAHRQICKGERADGAADLPSSRARGSEPRVSYHTQEEIQGRVNLLCFSKTE